MNQTYRLAERSINVLIRAGLSIATCESMTAGGICAALTQISGSSQVVRGGLITYASDLKASLAHVNPAHIAAHGVINAATAEQMAIGARQVCRSDVGLAITGVAGPDRQDGAPVGTVWLGLALPCDGEPVRSTCLALDGSREQIRSRAVDEALSWLCECLEP